jgi:hypothetical protein
MDVNRYKPYSTLRFRQVVSIQSNDFCIRFQLFLTSFIPVSPKLLFGE